jgi:hypothetical protein
VHPIYRSWYITYQSLNILSIVKPIHSHTVYCRALTYLQFDVKSVKSHVFSINLKNGDVVLSCANSHRFVTLTVIGGFIKIMGIIILAMAIVLTSGLASESTEQALIKDFARYSAHITSIVDRVNLN